MSNLCLACGLCCSGVLFSTVEVRAEELHLVPAADLNLQRRRDKHVFSLPCPVHREDRCTVYPQRPAICRQYECGLLRDHQAGRIGLPEALKIVAETRQRAREITSRLPSTDDGRALGLRLRDLADEMRADPGGPPSAGELLLDGVVLSQMIRTHFVRRKPDAGPMSGPDQPA